MVSATQPPTLPHSGPSPVETSRTLPGQGLLTPGVFLLSHLFSPFSVTFIKDKQHDPGDRAALTSRGQLVHRSHRAGPGGAMD